MGRHSMDYQPETGRTGEVAVPDSSIAPPGEPIDPGVPGAPEAPGREAPSTAPVEPPPVAPEQPDDVSLVARAGWRAMGSHLR